jgi:outer membrane protein W
MRLSANAIIFALILWATATVATAQFVNPTWIFRGGISPTIPVGDFATKESAKLGVGANLSWHYFIFRDLAVGATSGMHWTNSRNSSLPNFDSLSRSDFYTIPILASVQYHIIEKHDDILTPDPFFGLDLGPYIFFQNTRITQRISNSQDEPIEVNEKRNDIKVNFGVAPHVGVSTMFTTNIGIYLEARAHLTFGSQMRFLVTPNAGLVIRY